MPSRSNKHLAEVQERMNELGSRCGPAREWYFKSALTFEGNIPVPMQRNAARQGYSFSNLPEQELWKTWTSIWNSSASFHVLSQALLFVEQHRKKLELKHWKILKSWCPRIDNWAHSDSLSSYYASFLEGHPEVVLPVLEQWNGSKEPWKRRLSLTSLYYYASQRNSYPSVRTTIHFLENRMEDPHFYVQRGVGWATREFFNAYPRQALQFIEKWAPKFSSIAWQAAIEKLDPATRAKVSKLRA